MPYYNYLTRYKADFFFRSLTLRNSILDLKTLKAFFHTKNIKEEAKALKKNLFRIWIQGKQWKKSKLISQIRKCVECRTVFTWSRHFLSAIFTIEIERNIRINRFRRLFEVTASCTNDCNDDDEFSRKF